MTTTDKPLTDRIALVAGATRGAGRGIATALGEAGATVYCTGRTTRTTTSEYGRPETIEDTAERVTAAGGHGIAVRVDHGVPEEVAALIERIEREQGRLDLLVNDIGGEILHHQHWDQAVWEHDLDAGVRILRGMLETHLITTHFGLGLLHRNPGGLLVELTDGHDAYNDDHYRISAFFDLAKTGLNRLAWSQGHELAKHGCHAFSVTPGWLRSEMMLEGFGCTEDDWWERSLASTGAEGEPPKDFVISESPLFVGRGIAAAAADRGGQVWHQRSVTSYDLAEHYGLSDVDGSRPDSWRFITEVVEKGRPIDVTGYR